MIGKPKPIGCCLIEKKISSYFSFWLFIEEQKFPRNYPLNKTLTKIVALVCDGICFILSFSVYIPCLNRLK